MDIAILYSKKTTTDDDLKQYPNLKELHCHNNILITSTGINYIPNLTILNCGKNNNLKDRALLSLLYLEVLICASNTLFTNHGLSLTTTLLVFDCGNNNNFDDHVLRPMIALVELRLGKNKKITDIGLSYVGNLRILCCDYNSNITDSGLKMVPYLTKLVCGFNPNFTNRGLSYLPQLKVLICSVIGSNISISVNDLFLDHKITNSGILGLKQLQFLDCRNQYNIDWHILENQSLVKVIGYGPNFPEHKVMRCGKEVVRVYDDEVETCAVGCSVM